MNRTYRTFSTMLGGLAAVALAIASPSAWADDDDDDSDEIPFDEHEIFVELVIAVILHRVWIDDTQFRWGTEGARS